MKQIVWQNNIKELIYNKSSEEDFDKIMNSLNNLYATNIKISGKIWCDFKYLNTVLMLFFTHFKKFNNPKQVFFSLIFKNILKENSPDTAVNLDLFKAYVNVDTDFFICDNATKCGVYYLLTQDEYLSNDVNVTENDFQHFKDILLYCEVIKVRPNVWSGLLYDTEYGLSFKYKGSVDPSQLKELILPSIDIMKNNLDKFHIDYIKHAYYDRIMHVLDTYPTLKIKGR